MFTKGLFLLPLLLLATPKKTAIHAHEAYQFHSLRQAKIYNKIAMLTPDSTEERKRNLAQAIYTSAQKYRISPDVFISLINTESHFRFGMVSVTGDLSLVQINPMVWNKEFKRLGRDLIDADRIMKDEAYAIDRMGEILSLIRNRFKARDNRWCARYHSHTYHFRTLYYGKVSQTMKLLAAI